jgi:hypothetical protein
MQKISLSHSKSDTSETSATTALMKKLGLDVGDTTMAPRIGGVQHNGPALVTNAYNLYPKEGTNVFCYVVSIDADVAMGAVKEPKVIELTKKANGE